ncbi:hypothetical protein EMIT0210MI2_10732 [Priestia megaterium]
MAYVYPKDVVSKDPNEIDASPFKKDRLVYVFFMQNQPIPYSFQVFIIALFFLSSQREVCF